MKPVDQLTWNDCMRACVASILELPAEEVPNFMEEGVDYYQKKAVEYFNSIDYVAIELMVTTAEGTNVLEEVLFDIPVIVSGKSPRNTGKDCRANQGALDHAVIWHQNKLLHDPHPDRKGISGKPNRVILLFRKDPRL